VLLGLSVWLGDPRDSGYVDRQQHAFVKILRSYGLLDLHFDLCCRSVDTTIAARYAGIIRLREHIREKMGQQDRQFDTLS